MRGKRVQIAYFKRAPYWQLADLAVGPRLAVVVEETDTLWVVEDESGARHTIVRATREEESESPEQGRWVVCDPFPTYSIGERLTLGWRMRNASFPPQRREDFEAVVVAEDAECVTVIGPEGAAHQIVRANGHERIRIEAGNPTPIRRDEPRWMIVGRSLEGASE